MFAHRTVGQRGLIAVALCGLTAAALGGCSASSASRTSGQDPTVYACLASGQLTHVSLGSAPKCPAGSARIRWAARSGSAGGSGQGPTVSACLASGLLTRVAQGSAPKCPAGSARIRWAVRSGSAGGSGPGPTVSACLASGVLTRVAQGSAPGCAAGSARIRWTVQSDPESRPRALGAPCVTSAQTGGCGPYHYAGISGSDGYNTQVIQDMWNAIAGASQRLTAYNPGDWSVSADIPARNTAVVSYPDIQELYSTASNKPDPLSSFSSITSSFAENGPGSGGGDDYEAAYDIWAGTGTNNGAQEIMIWVDNHGQTPAGSKVGTADVGGTSYSVWSAGRNPVSLVLNSNETSGTIDILAALDWLESHGYMPAGSGVNQINFGWEICSTGGSAKTFSMTRYGIESSCASGASCL